MKEQMHQSALRLKTEIVLHAVHSDFVFYLEQLRNRGKPSHCSIKAMVSTCGIRTEKAEEYILCKRIQL